MAVNSRIYQDIELLKEQMAAVQDGITHLLTNTATNISDSDLNDLTGEICVGYGNNCTNRPAGAGNVGILSIFLHEQLRRY